MDRENVRPEIKKIRALRVYLMGILVFAMLLVQTRPRPTSVKTPTATKPVAKELETLSPIHAAVVPQVDLSVMSELARKFQRSLGVRASTWPRRSRSAKSASPKAKTTQVRTIKVKNSQVSKSRKSQLRLAAVLNRLIDQGLEEAPIEETFNWDPYLSAINWNIDLPADQQFIAPESAIAITEGELRRNDFSDLEAKLAEYAKAETPVVLPVIPESKPEPVAEAPMEVNSVIPEDSSPETALSEISEANTQTEPRPVTETESVVRQISETNSAPAPVPAKPELLPALVHKTDDAKIPLGPLMASVSQPKLPTLVTTQPSLSKAPASTQVNSPSVITQKTSSEPKAPTVKRRAITLKSEDADRVYGKLTFDKALSRWLDEKKGHVELYLSPAGSRDSQDNIFVDYHYPEREFEFDGKLLRGEYRLLAGIFTPEKPVAVAQIPYEKLISLENHREMITFHLRQAEVARSVARAPKSVGQVSLTVSVFEAASGDPRAPQPIASAEVSLFGFKNRGLMISDAEGNLDLGSLPKHSQVLLQVSAKGHYPTRVVVPLFDTDVHAPIYLIAKDKVETITKYFTKREQSPGKAVVLGRVFDRATRAPKAGAQVSLSGRQGRALYFQALPDLGLSETSDNGLFGFFNVETAARSVSASAMGVASLFSANANEGYYVELGRGGAADLQGKLYDPFRKMAINGKVRVVGSMGEVETDEAGHFVIPSIAVSPGILTLEIEAPGYPISWHSVAWNARQSPKKQTLYLVDNDLINESREAVAKVSNNAHQGNIIGGADRAIFSDPEACINVSLLNDQGAPVNGQGPYPLSSHVSLPLGHELCLTAENPGFAYYNLPPGRYLLQWKNPKGELLRHRVFYVGADRSSILVN